MVETYIQYPILQYITQATTSRVMLMCSRLNLIHQKVLSSQTTLYLSCKVSFYGIDYILVHSSFCWRKCELADHALINHSNLYQNRIDGPTTTYNDVKRDEKYFKFTKIEENKPFTVHDNCDQSYCCISVNFC